MDFRGVHLGLQDLSAILLAKRKLCPIKPRIFPTRTPTPILPNKAPPNPPLTLYPEEIPSRKVTIFQAHHSECRDLPRKLLVIGALQARARNCGGLCSSLFIRKPQLHTFLLEEASHLRKRYYNTISLLTVSTEVCSAFAPRQPTITKFSLFLISMISRFSFEQILLPFFSFISLTHESLSPRLNNGLAITPPMG